MGEGGGCFSFTTGSSGDGGSIWGGRLEEVEFRWVLDLALVADLIEAASLSPLLPVTDRAVVELFGLSALLADPGILERIAPRSERVDSLVSERPKEGSDSKAGPRSLLDDRSLLLEEDCWFPIMAENALVRFPNGASFAVVYRQVGWSVLWQRGCLCRAVAVQASGYGY